MTINPLLLSWQYNSNLDELVLSSIAPEVPTVKIPEASTRSISELLSIVPEEYHNNVREVYPHLHKP